MLFALLHLLSQLLHPLVDGLDSVLILFQHFLMLGSFFLSDDISFLSRCVKTCFGGLILLTQALILNLTKLQIQMITIIELSQEVVKLVSLEED